MEVTLFVAGHMETDTSPFLFAFLESPMSLYLNAVFLEDKLILSFNVVKQAERSCLHPSFILRQRK